MQRNSDEFKDILELTKIIAQEYLSCNEGRNITHLKETVKDLLLDPIWDNDYLYQLKQKVQKLEIDSDTINAIWKEIEEIFDSFYAKYLKNKSHMYEGKVRVYEKRLIEILVDAGKIKGQNTVFASIIGYLILHGGLTQSQLRELTGFSKGAISQSLKLLSHVPTIKKELIEGAREYLYTIGTNMNDIATNIGSYKSDTNELAIKFLKNKAQELETKKDKSGYEIISKRIGEVITFLEFNKKLLEKVKESSFMKELKEDNP